MDQDQYGAYLASHRAWVDAVSDLETNLHERALVRRFLENKTEISGLETPEFPPIKSIDLGRNYQSGGKTARIRLSIRDKREHTPPVSTKPHKAEKREAKKALSTARTVAQVKVVKARTVVANATLQEEVSDRLLASRQIRAALPLWKLEEQAAKSAAVRAKHIQLASSTQTVDVEPQNGWKLVTRKKGKELVPNSSVVQYDGSGKEVSTHVYSQDPQGPKTASIINAVRKPNAS
jgi:uncharacterized protein YkwD